MPEMQRMMSPFITAMQAALARIQAAETREERIEAEEHMAQLIRSQFLSDRRAPARDVKQQQAGRDE